MTAASILSNFLNLLRNMNICFTASLVLSVLTFQGPQRFNGKVS